MSEITIERTSLFLGTGSLRPFCWLYSATLNGVLYQNRSLVEMRRVIKKHCGDVKIVEPWKVAR